MLTLALLAAASAADLNPHANQLFEREPALKAWAVSQFDANRDGWLTLYEAQPAIAAFKEIADADRDGRVTVGEFEAAKAFVIARTGATATTASAAR